MTNWQLHRHKPIAFTFAIVLFALGKFSLDATAGKRSVTPFTFPSQVQLPGWQLLESRPLAKPKVDSIHDYEAIAAGQKYRYKQNNQSLEIEMRYVVGTLGSFPRYLENYSSNQFQEPQLLQNLRQRKEIGFYSLFVDRGRSHLVSCINPRGGSTVTGEQFFANRRTYDLQVQRMGLWLLGQESLIDRRCLWVDLSIPSDRMSAKNKYPVLEQAWFHWYQWWSLHFPQH